MQAWNFPLYISMEKITELPFKYMAFFSFYMTVALVELCLPKEVSCDATEGFRVRMSSPRKVSEVTDLLENAAPFTSSSLCCVLFWTYCLFVMHSLGLVRKVRENWGGVLKLNRWCVACLGEHLQCLNGIYPNPVYGSHPPPTGYEMQIETYLLMGRNKDFGFALISSCFFFLREDFTLF